MHIRLSGLSFVTHLLSVRSTHYDAGGPGIEQEEGTDQKCAGEHDADGQQQPVAQTNILFPEQEWVAVGIRGQALSAVVAADGPHALDGFHKLRRLPEPVEVEGELCVFNRLSSWNWVETQGKERKVNLLVVERHRAVLFISKHALIFADSMKQLMRS